MFRTARDKDPAYHALVIGVSHYPHLDGGGRKPTKNPLADDLGQLPGAASSAVHVASWIRDHLRSAVDGRGSIRLLISPVPEEQGQLEGLKAPRATRRSVEMAVYDWLADVRCHQDNVAIVYVAGHGIQKTDEGAILLLEDFGKPKTPEVLTNSLDVMALQRGTKDDESNQPGSVTPRLQFYFYDSCRAHPELLDQYYTAGAGIRIPEPIGTQAPIASLISCGTLSRGTAWVDPNTYSTLYSQALIDCLDELVDTGEDGTTIRWGWLHMMLEKVLADRAEARDVAQQADQGGRGPARTVVHRRPPVEGLVEPAMERNVRFSIEPPMPAVVSRRTADGRMVPVAEVTDGATVALSVGGYEVDIPHPWNGNHSGQDGNLPRPVEVSAEDSEFAVSSDDWLEWEFGPNPLIFQQLAGAASRPARGSTEDHHIRLLRWAFDRDTSTAGFAPIVADSSAATVVGHRGYGATGSVVDIAATPQSVVAAQVRTASGRSIVTVLPAVPEQLNYELYLHSGDDGRLATLVRFGTRRTDTMAGFMTARRPDRVLAMAPQGNFKALLWNGDSDEALVMALTGYALLKVDSGSKNLQWVEDFADKHAWLPDSALLAAAYYSRTRDTKRVLNYLREAETRGLPYFTSGLSFMIAESESLAYNLGSDPAVALFGRLRHLAARADFSALCATFRIDPVWGGKFSAADGWQRLPIGTSGEVEAGWSVQTKDWSFQTPITETQKPITETEEDAPLKFTTAGESFDDE